MSSAWAGGSTRKWRRIRAAVLARDGYACRLQLAGCTGRATHAHHVYGRAQTGDDPRYIVASCASCNLKTGQPGRPRGARRLPPRPRQPQVLGTYDRWLSAR